MARHDSKRIAIARAIMYKELAKRNAERERECKRRGLWLLWQEQTEYKTLWHFLRASDECLIDVCYKTLDHISDRAQNLTIRYEQYVNAHRKKPNDDTYKNIAIFQNRIASCEYSIMKINELLNKLTGGNSNENQN